MRHFFTIVFSVVIFSGLLTAQDLMQVVAGYNYDAADSSQAGFGSIRAVNYSADLFGDGIPGIVATNYNLNGLVHVFAPVGDDSLELKWTSPQLANGGGSTPRFVTFGDLDNDGIVEVIFQSSGNGFMIFEWDGVPGSYNFGTVPSQQIGDAYFPDVSGNAEWFEIVDLDGDGFNELLTAYNASGTAGDGFFIFSAAGEWEHENPGFSGFTKEFEALRGDWQSHGFDGSPYAMFSANLDGEGNREGIIHNWNRKNVTILRATGVDEYQMANAANGLQNVYLTGFTDEVALFAGFATDVDKDGREEVYLPTFNTSDTKPGQVHMIYYNSGDELDEIEKESNVVEFDITSTVPDRGFLGHGYGDYDKDGKPNLYFTTTYPYNVTSMEFQGGDKTDPANWKTEVLYEGESSIIDEITYRDSLGVLDTITTINTAFPSKIVARNTDFDNDGFEDMIMGYQAISDTITYIRSVWDGERFVDSTLNKTPKPKKWSLRIIEATGLTGLEEKDLTVVTPQDYVLKQNYPNPFNPTTNIEFYLPVRNNISLTIYNASGQVVKTLISNASMNKGSHMVQWDGTNISGEKVATGMYIYQLKFGNFAQNKRMMLVK